MALEEKLIVEVSKHKPLYDQSLPEFKDTEIKNNIWATITRKLMERDDPETIDKVKQRWKSLRDTYVKTIKKRNLNKNGHPFSKNKPYRYGKLMEFLDPYVRARHGQQGHNASSSQYDGTSDVDTSGVPDDPISVVKLSPMNAKDYGQLAENEPSTSVVTVVKAESLPLRKKRKKENYVETMASPMKMMKKSHQHTYRNDVDDFFHGLAQTVKKLRPLTIARIKKHVANVVMDAEMDELQYYDVNQYVTAGSPCSPPETSAHSMAYESSSSSASYHEEH